MSFSRPDIQLMRDLIAFLLRQIFHADAFRNVLPDQAVQIFITAALPGVIRRGEVTKHGKARFERLVVMKLGAVVQREGVKLAGVLGDGSGGRCRDFGRRARLEFLDDGVA